MHIDFSHLDRFNVSFPRNENTAFKLITGNANSEICVSVYKHSNKEARFLVKGKLTTSEDIKLSLQTAETLALSYGCSLLVTQEKIDPYHLDGLNTFVRSGFIKTDESIVYAGSFTTFFERIRCIYLKLKSKGVIPSHAIFTNLSKVKKEVRSILNDNHMMDDYEFDFRLKDKATYNICENLSMVAMVDKKIIGILLVSASFDDNTFYIPIRFIDSDFRHSWVNPILMYSCILQLFALNAKTIQFEANLLTHLETINFAEKMGCLSLASYNRFSKSI